jgi:chorismate mutase/prephenate dehydratase
MSKKLQEIRKKIDELDNKIHDVLMQRAELIEDIAAEKRKKNLQFVHPAREAQMIRRLMARHEGALPEAAIVRIWRELVGAVSLLQTGLKVSVYAEGENPLLWDYAKSYFGSVVTMQRLSSPLTAISSVREGESSFAVLPWPRDDEENAWWTYLLYEQDLKIVCALPYGQIEGDTSDPLNRGLVVSKINFDDSGEDHSFIALEVDQSVSRGRIVSVLQELGFDVLGITTKSRAGAVGHSMHLIEVDDYLDQQDERLEKFRAKFDEQEGRCAALGGYPVPPVYRKLNMFSVGKALPRAPAIESADDA